jgi:polyhydroxyalkanoate synthesis regulator protein
MAMMERAMSLFAPFARRDEAPSGGPGEVDALKAEVEALRRELAALRQTRGKA